MTVPSPGEHGDDLERVARSLGVNPSSMLDLSVSVNPVAPDVTAIAARHLDGLARYPDTGEATASLAEALGVAPRQVLLTNGGAEAIALVAADVGRGWAEHDDFSLYRRHLDTLDPDGPRFRSDPHNPTGRLAGPDEHAHVWDEAFYPLATGRWSSGRVAIVVGSLTKLFACPGLRLGYVVADPPTIERLGRRQPAWSVSGLAAAMVPDLLGTADLAGWARRVAELRGQLHDLLASAGLDPQPSDANFVLCAAAGDLRSRLAPAGILVRDCATFGRPGQARVAVPGERGIERLAAALAATR